MRLSRRVAGLALLGLLAAVGIGLAAHAVTRDSIGLSASPSAEEELLAPPEASQPARGREAGARRGRRRTRELTDTAPRAPAPPPAPSGGDADRPETEGGEGGGRGRGRGGESDGSGRGRGRGGSGDD